MTTQSWTLWTYSCPFACRSNLPWRTRTRTWTWTGRNTHWPFGGAFLCNFLGCWGWRWRRWRWRRGYSRRGGRGGRFRFLFFQSGLFNVFLTGRLDFGSFRWTTPFSSLLFFSPSSSPFILTWFSVSSSYRISSLSLPSFIGFFLLSSLLLLSLSFSQLYHLSFFSLLSFFALSFFFSFSFFLSSSFFLRLSFFHLSLLSSFSVFFFLPLSLPFLSLPFPFLFLFILLSF